MPKIMCVPSDIINMVVSAAIAGAASATPSPPSYAAAACDWMEAVQGWLQPPFDAEPPPCEKALHFWLGMCSPVEMSTASEPSLFHALGVGLSGALSQHPLVLSSSAFDESTAFGSLKDLILIHETPIAQISWLQLTDTISACRWNFATSSCFTPTPDSAPLLTSTTS